MRLTMALLVCALASHAAGIDDRWTASATVHSQKSAEKQVAFTLDLKTLDGKLTGSVNVDGGKRSRLQIIENGKVEGDRVTFSTHVKNKKRDATFLWVAAVNGDQLTGTRTREGAKKGLEFTAKRAN